MRDRKETDDILFALDKAYLLLSNKSLPDQNKESWLKALRPYSTNEILDAIDNHVNGGSGTQSQYAPKPKHIIDLISNSRGRRRGMEKPKDSEKPCDPRIAKAWVTAIRIFYDMEVTDNNPEVKMTRDEALDIVNSEAAKYKNPDAIPDEYKLPKYWN